MELNCISVSLSSYFPYILVLTFSRYTQIWFGLRCMFPTWKDWDLTYTKKGRVKRAGMRAVSILTLMAAISGILRLRQAAQGQGVRALFADMSREVLLRGSTLLQRASTKV